MGNQVCCDDLREEINPVDTIEKIVLTKDHPQRQQNPLQQQFNIPENPPTITLPQIAPRVRSTLEKQLFFATELGEVKPILRKYKDDVYEGELDSEEHRPHGWGRMYKADGSLFIGQFAHGKAEGKGAYIFPDGSYYFGDIDNNAANCAKGYFESQALSYKGGFKDNAFEGQGYEEGAGYSFDGEYKGGKKINGNFKWTSGGVEFSYRGSFNKSEKFDGHGRLEDELGTYEGEFREGLKEGKGEYTGKNGVSYKGEYRGDKKEGQGTIFNHDGTMAYRGQFKNGLPHGKGSTFSGAREIEAFWSEGIDTRLLASSPPSAQ